MHSHESPGAGTLFGYDPDLLAYTLTADHAAAQPPARHNGPHQGAAQITSILNTTPWYSASGHTGTLTWAAGRTPQRALTLTLVLLTVTGAAVLTPDRRSVYPRHTHPISALTTPDDLACSKNTTDALRLLLCRSNLSLQRDITELHPTHLLRDHNDNFHLGGWARTPLSIEQLTDVLPAKQPLWEHPIARHRRATPWSGAQPQPAMTATARYHLNAALEHVHGRLLDVPLWQP